MKVPAISLVHSIPIDADHVAVLAENIKANGQYSAVLVRRLTHDIIDGFHRVMAMQLLGMDVEIDEKDMTDEEFLAARIVSATQHEGVKIDRAVTWIDEEWANLPFASKYKGAAAAFSAYSKGQAPDDVAAWVEKQSARWGAAVNTIKNHWLYQTTGKGTASGTPEKVETSHSTVKGDRELTDPESMPPKLRNVWADAKVFISEAKRITDSDMMDIPEEHKTMLDEALSELGTEADRLYAYL